MQRDIFFAPDGHKERFIAAMNAYSKPRGPEGKLDEEYAAAYYILTNDADLWEVALLHIEGRAPDVQSLIKLPYWSGGYLRLLSLAGNLFNNRTPVSLHDLRAVLDSHNLTIAFTAIDIFLNGLSMDELEGRSATE